MKLLLPLLLLLIGSGAGVGAGIYLRPTTDGMPDKATAHTAEKHAPNDHGAEGAGEENGIEYVKLSNQFVVPIIKRGNVASLVVLALSLEVPSGSKESTFRREPKLRDSFLQVLFDHANVGGFDGEFTDALMLARLRDALREVAQRDLGEEEVNDVLILEIARQDY